MTTLSIRADKESYAIGQTARLDVLVEWDPPEAKTDVWASLDILQRHPETGEWVAYLHYDPAPLHDANPDESVSGSWWCHPIRRGRWGYFRARASIFEPERGPVGSDECDFAVTPP